MNEVQKLRDLLTKYTARTAVGLEKQRLFTRDMLGFFSDQDLKHLEELISKERAERKMEDELDKFEMREHEHALRNSDGRMI